MLAGPGRTMCCCSQCGEGWLFIFRSGKLKEFISSYFTYSRGPRKWKGKYAQNWLSHVCSQIILITLENVGQGGWSVWPHNTVPSWRMKSITYFTGMQKCRNHPAEWNKVTSACLFSHFCLVIWVFPFAHPSEICDTLQPPWWDCLAWSVLGRISCSVCEPGSARWTFILFIIGPWPCGFFFLSCTVYFWFVPQISDLLSFKFRFQ